MAQTAFVKTHSGLLIDLLNPDPKFINPEDIAMGLSRELHWANQSRKGISVAEHSILVAELCEDKFQALFHDAPEYLLRDLPGPLKLAIPAYKKIEEKLMLAIAQALGIKMPFGDDLKMNDNIVLNMEFHYLMHKPSESSYEDHSETIKCLDSGHAYAAFMDAYHKYKTNG